MARHPSRANRSLDETSLKRDFQNAPGFRTSDRARPRAGHSKSERQSTHVFKLDEPVPKWLKLWRATGPTPTAVSDPIENAESPAWTLQMMKHCVMQCLLFELYDMIPEELSYQKTKRKVKAKVKAKAKTQTTPTPSQDPTGASAMHLPLTAKLKWTLASHMIMGVWCFLKPHRRHGLPGNWVLHHLLQRAQRHHLRELVRQLAPRQKPKLVDKMQ